MVYGTIEMKNGEIIYLERGSLTGSSEGPVKASLRDSIKGALNLSDEVAKVGRFLEELRKGIFEELADHRPNSVELEVGLSFDQTVGCVLVGSSLNAQVNLKMTWDNKNGAT